MAVLPHSIPDLDRKGYRDFALVTGGIIVAIFGLFFPWKFEFNYPVTPWIIFGVLGAWGLIAPMSLRPVYRAWMHFGLLVSRVTTPVIMGLAFFVVFVPVGLVMRLFGKDAMTRQFDQSAESYRVVSKKGPVKNLEKPF